MARSPSIRSPLSLLLALALMGVMLTILRERTETNENAQVDFEPCLEPDNRDCETISSSSVATRGGEASQDPTVPLLLQAGSVCRNVGYLCAEVWASDTLRILRWPESTQEIRVWVPRPDGLPPEDARALQLAAVSGIRVWHEFPFPIEVSARTIPNDPHITVEWQQNLGGNRLGHTQMRWRREGEVVQVEIPGLLLVTHDPNAPGALLNPDQLRLIAAHEMGHALGLPHSDNPRDVMFPQNTAWRRTRRDFETMEALYRMPNGALIRR